MTWVTHGGLPWADMNATTTSRRGVGALCPFRCAASLAIIRTNFIEHEWAKEDVLAALNATPEMRLEGQYSANIIVMRNTPQLRRPASSISPPSPLHCQNCGVRFILHVFEGPGYGVLKHAKMNLRPQ